MRYIFGVLYSKLYFGRPLYYTARFSFHSVIKEVKQQMH